MTQRRVSVIGPVNIDLLMVGEGPADWDDLPRWDGPATMQMAAGGAVGYFAQDQALMGDAVRLASCVPDDALGSFLIETLERRGVSTDLIRRVPDTLVGIAAFVLLFGSRKRPLVHRAPTHPLWPIEYSEAERAALLAADHLHVGGYLHYGGAWGGQTTALLRAAKESGLSTSLDPQFPLIPLDPPWMAVMTDALGWVDTLFCDETEARQLTGDDALQECADALLAAGPRVVVIKQGAEGATAYTDGGSIRQSAVSLGPVEDTIGAGDAFDAGYVYGTLRGWPLSKRLRYAATAAGFTVTGVGGTSALPTVAEIVEMMG